LCVLGCKTRIDYLFESSMYEPVSDYHELEVYTAHSILSKFCNQAHKWLDHCKRVLRV